MSQTGKTYTYRGGRKVGLRKNPDLMVVRALPDQMDDAAIIELEQVSYASTRITH